jgi:branched-chain amino acid transport system permease protein
MNDTVTRLQSQPGLARRVKGTAPFAAVLALLSVLPFFVPEFWLFLFCEVFVLALAATALSLLAGYTGLVSFGHAAYYGIGAYACGILVTGSGVPVWLGILLAPFIALLAAAVIGFFSVRLTEIYFAFLTMAFAQMFWVIAQKWTRITNGYNGIVGITRPNVIQSTDHLYWFCLLVVTVCFFLLWVIIRSPFGLLLRSLRDSPVRVRYLGVYLHRHKLVCFMISGFFTGVAGTLSTLISGSVFPDSLYIWKSAEMLVSILMGGMYVFTGPAVGAIVVVVVNHVIGTYTEYWAFWFGLIFVLIVIFLPRGIVGSVWHRLKRRERME